MRKISMKLFAFLFALFAYQGAMAQEVLFQENFSTGLGEFTIEGNNGEKNNIWSWDSYYKHAYADGYGKFVEGPIEVYLVSPEIALKTENKVSFSKYAKFFVDLENEVNLSIRLAGSTEWVVIPADFTGGSEFDLSNTGQIDVPAEYENEKVQFGFRYSSKQSNSSGILHISDFLVQSGSGDVPVEPTPAEEKVLFSETFQESAGSFHEVYTEGVGNIWQWMSNLKMVSAYAGGVQADSRFISPEIALLTNNKVSFEYVAMEFSDFANQTSVSIRKVGGEWTEMPITPVDLSGSPIAVELAIPAEFNNNKVEIAFRYNASSGYLLIGNIVVKGQEGGDTPAVKADPEISFNVGDVEAIMGQAFEAPVLNNPNNVEIVYSSNKPEVATVDPQTGAVTLVGEGFTTITATSVENDQFKSAFVNYVLTVKPAGDADIIFSESFELGLGEFTTEGEGAADVWNYYYSAARADGYNKVSGESVSYLVSPVITLKSNNVMSFEYESMYFAPERIDNDMRMAIRLEGGEWTYLEIPNRVGQTGEVAQSGDIVIPAEFDNQKVQIAFAYGCDGTMSSGMWYVRNLVVKGAAAPAEKKDPELSFAQDTYEFYFDHSSFDGVALNNPNNLEVVYSIENNDYSVADVEPSTGKVWIYNCGTVVITATSAETDEFKEGKASYTLIITEDVPTGIEGITADDLENGKIYDLQGRRVNKLTKGVFIVNGKKVVIK